MKLLLISITTIVVLLGLLLSLLIIFSIPKIPKIYVSTISFYDGQTDRILPNQPFYISYAEDSWTIETCSEIQTDNTGHVTTEIKKISKSWLRIHKGHYGDTKFFYRIPADQIVEGVEIKPKVSDERSDTEQRKQPITPPRLEIKVKKKGFF